MVSARIMILPQKEKKPRLFCFVGGVKTSALRFKYGCRHPLTVSTLVVCTEPCRKLYIPVTMKTHESRVFRLRSSASKNFRVILAEGAP